MNKKKVVKGCVYLLRNLANGKRYVGKYKDVRTVERRWARHIGTALNSDDSRPLYRAIRKTYSASNGATLGFTAEVLWRGLGKEAAAKEIYYIRRLHSYIADPLGNRSYNLTKGGDGVLGLRHTPAARLNISFGTRAAFEKFTSAHWSSLRKKVWASKSKEFKRNFSATQSVSAKIAWAAKTPEELALNKKIQSAAQKKVWARRSKKERAALRKKSSEAQKKRFCSRAGRAKHKAAMSKPGVRAKISKSRQAVWDSCTAEQRAEFSKAVSKAGKKRWAAVTPAERKKHGKKSSQGRKHISKK